jgi:hypothetical protein
VTNKRFDTRFFVTQVPDDQLAEHDNFEATEALWIQPREALMRYWDREIELAPPQIMSLVHLSRHPHAQSVLAEAQNRRPPSSSRNPLTKTASAPSVTRAIRGTRSGKRPFLAPAV